MRKFSLDSIDIRGPDECWPWTGPLAGGGYGGCRYEGKKMAASRASFIYHNGAPAPGLLVCHHCDNRACCNPSHLFAGTQVENMADCIRKGRFKYRAWPKGIKLQAKLSDSQVVELRDRYRKGGISQRAIAKVFGITQSSVGRIVRGESYSDIKGGL